MASTSCLLPLSHEPSLPPSSSSSSSICSTHYPQPPAQEDPFFFLYLVQNQPVFPSAPSLPTFEPVKMSRKRHASELDLQPEATSSYHPTRRRPTVAPISSSADQLFFPEPRSSLFPTQTNPLPSLPPLPSTALPLPPPSSTVCGFSGLPMFSSDHEQTTTQQSSPLEAVADDSLGGASAWIDGIIRDLINSAAAEVSIPQIIHNVREVIHPCNPSLASVLEFRLRSLTSDLIPPPLPSVPVAVATEPLDFRRGVNRYVQSSRRELPPVPKRNDSSFHYTSASATGSSGQGNFPVGWDEQPNPNVIYPRFPSSGAPAAPPAKQQRSSASASSEEVTPTPTPTPTHTGVVAVAKERKEELRQQKRDEEGLHLLTLLLQCAEAVAADNLEEANRLLLEISELSTPFGTSAQRVAAYFSEAMSARLVSSCLGIYSPFPPIASHRQRLATAFQVFNGISPFVKFSHFTANQAIQEAFEREDRVHIIDLDIMQGLQWPGLFHILASRPGGPPRVRLTGLGSSLDSLQATGKQLSDFADTLGLPFEFCPVAEKVGNLDPERLCVSRREALAVHWLHHSLYDVTGSDTNTLWLLQRLEPKVVTMVEQDLSQAGSFLARFVEAIHYYSALFDSLGATYGEDSQEAYSRTAAAV
ncbi:hypothetical protein HPP92_022890 [Vanilla planifolia]|uniref:Uncharacterized protein n=1 Tax=Vanilla planifolia TaxID=51239 RepID=A0A835UDY8_VANPL|nr:hypothetical protein HPP92_022890 [Vanilla planifolia]